MDRVERALPPIPAKRYFTIGEVSELCLVKPYVLRYWEQEFVQLKPMKRRGNRRYYQHHEVLLIRRIRELLYEQGFTISGARNQLAESGVQGAAPLAQGLEVDGHEPEFEPAMGAALEESMPSGGGGVRATRVTTGAPKVPAGWHGGVDGQRAGAARALHASAPAVADALWLEPALPDLDKLTPQGAAALREALLSIRDMLG